MLRINYFVFVFFMCFSALGWTEDCKSIYGEKRSFSSPMIQEIFDRTASVNLVQPANIDVTDIVIKYIPVQMDKAEKETLLKKEGFKLDEYSFIYVLKKCAWRDKKYYRSQIINISRVNNDAWAGYEDGTQSDIENIKESTDPQQGEKQ